ncbi:MAG: hypothetical protein ACI837_002703 [Crocinitomicaceae bacterium]|jgi:hypothetical protein
MWYNNEMTDDDATSLLNGENGVLVLRIDQDGNILWERRLRNPSTSNVKPEFAPSASLIRNDSLFIHVVERRYYPWSENLNFAKNHFYIFDTLGNELDHQIVQDGQFNYGWEGYINVNNTRIYSNFVSEYSPHSISGQLVWKYRPVITSVNPSNQINWKDTLSPDFVFWFEYDAPMKLIQSSDSSFAGAFTYTEGYINEDTTVFYVLLPIELFNKSIETGEDIWKRNYRYFPEDSARRYIHEIIDIERTSDDGYIMCGSVIAQDSLAAGKPGQYGYVIKTNCLGYLGDPQVAVSYSFGEDNTVLFENESIQAGGYHWDFGDGDTLLTGEAPTLISHSYDASGIYYIELMGFGCNGQADTLLFSIDFEYTDPAYAGDGTLLTLYPNPVLSGNSIAFFVGDIPDGDNYVYVYNELGQRVDRFPIEAANTNYIFLADYAAGVYHFVLENNSEVIETEKLLVQ